MSTGTQLYFIFSFCAFAPPGGGSDKQVVRKPHCRNEVMEYFHNVQHWGNIYFVLLILYMHTWYPEWGQTSIPGLGEFRKTPTELFRSKSQLEDSGTFFLLGFQPFPKLCFSKASFELLHELEQYYNCLDFKYNIFKVGTIYIPENKVILEE